jgi:hypothetical protein
MSFDPLIDTIPLTEKWLLMSDGLRKKAIKDVVDMNIRGISIEVTNAPDNGMVVLKIVDTIPSNERGLFLLGLEKEVKNNVDQGLTIWLEPVGDKSKLRQLRGVEIKK